MEYLRRHNYEKMLYAGLDTVIKMEQQPSNELAESTTDDGWTPELLDWFIAAITVALELPENRDILEKMRRVE